MEYSFRSVRGSPLHFLTGSATLVGKVCSPAWTQARKFLPISTNLATAPPVVSHLAVFASVNCFLVSPARMRIYPMSAKCL